MDVPQLFSQSLIEGQLGCFQFGVIINNMYKDAPSSINLGMQTIGGHLDAHSQQSGWRKCDS